MAFGMRVIPSSALTPAGARSLSSASMRSSALSSDRTDPTTAGAAPDRGALTREDWGVCRDVLVDGLFFFDMEMLTSLDWRSSRRTDTNGLSSVGRIVLSPPAAGVGIPQFLRHEPPPSGWVSSLCADITTSGKGLHVP